MANEQQAWYTNQAKSSETNTSQAYPLPPAVKPSTITKSVDSVDPTILGYPTIVDNTLIKMDNRVKNSLQEN